MFTGIVEKMGTVLRLEKTSGKRPALLELKTAGLAAGLKPGGSLAVNGACLTVSSKKQTSVLFHLVKETVRRTNLGCLRRGDRVNLERPLKTGGRLEGHFVLGHVDGIGSVIRVIGQGRQKSVLIGFPRRLSPYMLEKGSVAINGVSLTLGKVQRGAFWAHLIPHTLASTNLNCLKSETKVNLEVDILTKLAVREFRNRLKTSFRGRTRVQTPRIRTRGSK